MRRATRSIRAGAHEGAAMTDPLLAVSDLRVSFATPHGPFEALRGIDLAVGPGEVMGVVGESGSGKSVTALSVMGLLDRKARLTGGTIRFRGEDISRASRRRLRSLRGSALSMIFQNPRSALNPVRRIGQQIGDALSAHLGLSRAEAWAQAIELLRTVQFRDPERHMLSYPHELSGGMCQRVMIAMAIACRPQLLLADEPTTGLDVTTQKHVMDLLIGLVHERGMAMVLITHDLGLAAHYCRRIAVMEQGRVVEENAAAALFAEPQHPYTRRLVAASPTRESTIEGLAGGDANLPPPVPQAHRSGLGPLLEVRDLVKRFANGTTAVNGVSFTLAPSGSLGLVGESGSGKSTISRLICRLLDQTAGEIIFEGQDIGSVRERDFHRSPHRRDIQIVFQDALESLNPRFAAFESIADPLRRLAGLRARRSLAGEVEDAARRVGLPLDLLHRLPHQLSGGQRARVGIARAIAVRPRLLVLDEPTAALDVSVQAVVLQLLERLRRESGMAYLFISHDLGIVRMLCEQVIVLRAGRIVEAGATNDIFKNPRAAYTRELLEAIPHFVPGRRAPCAASPDVTGVPA
jgi:peptide/nickel transport system ATP-binding protein